MHRRLKAGAARALRHAREESRDEDHAASLLGKYGFKDSCLGCLPHQQGLDHREHNIMGRNRIYGQMMIDVDELGRIRLHEERMGRMPGKDERVRRMNESDVPQSTSVDAGNGGVVSPNADRAPPFVWGLEVAAHQEIIDEAMEGNDVQDPGEGPGT